MSRYAPSKYQQAILDWLTNETGSALVQARAGSGKTSTLVMLANAMPRRNRATFLAFNKSIATELQTKLPDHVSASTFHSFTYGPLRRYVEQKERTKISPRTWVDSRKVDSIYDANYPNMLGARSATTKLVGLMKAHGLLPECSHDELAALMAHFDVECDDENVTQLEVMNMAQTVLTLNNRQLMTIDFDDMLYLPIVFGLKLETFDYVMVDESQDTNEIQRAILRKICHAKTRVIAVGDEAQAIYGFRGASSDSMAQIQREFDCVTLPLSISYRCPASVIRLAQQIVPDIEARDGAPEGMVEYPASYKVSEFTPDTLVICRNTAPLVKVAYRLIRERVACRFLGREIGAGLTALIKRVAGKRTTLAELPDKLLEWQIREIERAVKQRQEGRIQTITDKVETLLTLIESMTPGDRANGIPGLLSIITDMFADKKGKMVTFATIHKSKGLEAPHVVILDEQLMPSKYAKQEWQLQQEHNLRYVAITRSLERLSFVSSATIAN